MRSTSMIRRQRHRHRRLRRHHRHYMITCMIVKACTTEETYTHKRTNTTGIHDTKINDEHG